MREISDAGIDRQEAVKMLSDKEHGEEYVAEAENQSGKEYWNRFDSLRELSDDYELFASNVQDITEA